MYSHRSPDNIHIVTVYRINWLRAKARFDRWDEELITVCHEMKWTVMWFGHQAGEWRRRAEQSQLIGKQGLQAYAEKQVVMWETFREEAVKGFRGMMSA
jgi:hypothetical protein